MENPTPMSESQPQRRSIRTVTPLSVPAIDGAGTLRLPLKQQALDALVRGALDEDGAFDDLTTIATVVSERRARASLVARENGIICGVALALNAFRLLDPKVAIRIDAEDGMRVSPGSSILFVNGNARALLSAERVALNFLQRLSGIASLTAQFVAAIEGTGAKILDTRKTTPGWRQLEKYAVRAGGGSNHRMDLSSAVLIKDNHLAALDGDIAVAVHRARELAPGVKVEVECDTIEQVDRALADKDLGADRIAGRQPPSDPAAAIHIAAEPDHSAPSDQLFSGQAAAGRRQLPLSGRPDRVDDRVLAMGQV